VQQVEGKLRRASGARLPEFARFRLMRNVLYNYKFQIGPVVAMILLASAFPAVAQSPIAVAAYPFSDSPASSVMTGSTLASAIGIGPGASPWIYSNVAAQGKSALFRNAGFNTSTETAAVNANDYIAFTVTPTNGSIGITEIRFSSLRTTGNGSAAPDNFVIRTEDGGLVPFAPPNVCFPHSFRLPARTAQ